MAVLSDVLVSFWQLTTQVVLAKKARVLFYYPQHFNRTAQATNPFFDRLLETCNRHGISYKLIEEPDWGTDKPRNSRAIKGDFLFVVITLIRKLVKYCGVKDIMRQERTTAKIVNILTFGRLRYPRYITISGSMLEVFLYLNQNAIVYDMQHGILYKQHPTFFDEHEHLRHYIANEPRWHWMMWGKGYEQCFIRGEEELMRGRTHVVGYPIQIEQVRCTVESPGKAILFSLQLTQDDTAERLLEQKELFENALQALQTLGVRVLLKQHPRYNNAIPIDDLLEKYSFTEITTLPMQLLARQVMLQVTVNSTTSFEYAAEGIPSYFIDPDETLPRGALFYTEYGYPLYRGMSLYCVAERLLQEDNRSQDSAIVKSWYRLFYDDFGEQEFLKLI